MKYSRQREMILTALQNNVVHPSADYIYNIVRKELPKISLATVYRNLNLLAENAVIKRIEGLDGSVHFDHNTHTHYHFICNKCGKVFDVPAHIVPEMASRVEEETGLCVEKCDISFKGICSNCKTNN